MEYYYKPQSTGRRIKMELSKYGGYKQPSTMPSSVECYCSRAFQGVKKSERFKNVFLHGEDCRCAPSHSFFNEKASLTLFPDINVAIHAEHEKPYLPSKRTGRRKR